MIVQHPVIDVLDNNLYYQYGVLGAGCMMGSKTRKQTQRSYPARDDPRTTLKSRRHGPVPAIRQHHYEADDPSRAHDIEGVLLFRFESPPVIATRSPRAKVAVLRDLNFFFIPL